MAELLEEYTALVTRVLEHMVEDAPFPRRVRVLVRRSLPFASHHHHHPLLPAPVA
ncbi:hypothetical protein HS088_TW20G00168 [Tripterygium wilfordii]|uniref:Uncharacterized protein n=1 Tax=Tripterygium wilfordii TaxID=458696 RepID=A0A7J7C6L4_TRIWF|nr:hypothetical protein HS088_TW20G00168 [Tripterygium wilfordii]